MNSVYFLYTGCCYDVSMKDIVLWDMTSYLVEIYQLFGSKIALGILQFASRIC